MAGLLFVSPGVFTNPEDLPQVPPTPVVPIRGATIDWAADRLPAGTVSSWTDMLGANTLEGPAAASQYPIAAGAGAARRVEFDGANDRIDTTIGISQPCTMVVVARAVNANPTDYMLTGGTRQAWNLGINAGGRWIFSAGTGSSILSPTTQPADDAWHVFVVVVNGGSSVLNVDGIETVGTIDPVTWDTLRIGASSSAYYPVHLRRLAVIPKAVSAAERYSIRTRLSNHYGI